MAGCGVSRRLTRGALVAQRVSWVWGGALLTNIGHLHGLAQLAAAWEFGGYLRRFAIQRFLAIVGGIDIAAVAMGHNAVGAALVFAGVGSMAAAAVVLVSSPDKARAAVPAASSWLSCRKAGRTCRAPRVRQRLFNICTTGVLGYTKWCEERGRRGYWTAKFATSCCRNLGVSCVSAPSSPAKSARHRGYVRHTESFG